MTTTPPGAPTPFDWDPWKAKARLAGDAIGPMVGKWGPLLMGGMEFADSTPGETALANAFDALGATGGAWGGSAAGGALAMRLGAAAPHPLLKAALMATGLVLGSGIGKNVARGVGDLATGGATRNTPENQALRNEQKQFEQRLSQAVRQAQTMSPLLQQQGLINNQLNNLARDAELRRQLDAQYAATLYGAVAQSSLNGSAAASNSLNALMRS